MASAKKVMGSGAEGKKSGGEEEEEKGVVSWGAEESLGGQDL